jgi:hypothetical protein
MHEPRRVGTRTHASTEVLLLFRKLVAAHHRALGQLRVVSSILTRRATVRLLNNTDRWLILSEVRILFHTVSLRSTSSGNTAKEGDSQLYEIVMCKISRDRVSALSVGSLSWPSSWHGSSWLLLASAVCTAMLLVLLTSYSYWHSFSVREGGLHCYDPSSKKIFRVSCFEYCTQQCTLVLDNQRCRRCSCSTTTWHPMPSSHRSSLPWPEVMTFSWRVGYGNLRTLMFVTVARQSNMDMDMAELTV